MATLEMQDYPDFEKHFFEVKQSVQTAELARMVWELASQQYEKGYRQGRDDPDFNNDPE